MTNRLSKSVYWAKKFLARNSVKVRLKKAEDAVFGRIDIDQDVKLAEATAKLSESLCKNNQEIVFDGGSFIFCKKKVLDGQFRIYAKRLSIDERELINKNPFLLDDPENLSDRMNLIALPKPSEEGT